MLLIYFNQSLMSCQAKLYVALRGVFKLKISRENQQNMQMQALGGAVQVVAESAATGDRRPCCRRAARSDVAFVLQPPAFLHRESAAAAAAASRSYRALQSTTCSVGLS